MSTNSAPIKIAVVGVGLIGVRHAKLIHELEGFSLCALIDPAKNAEAIALELSVPIFKNLDDFFSSDIECDGAVIATPNETHKQFSIDCFENNIPCLIEKPLAANSKDASEILAASEKHNVPAIVGHHRRHHLVSATLKEKIDAGEFGTLVGAQLTWMLRKPTDYFAAAPWRTQAGGGPVWINLIHEIDLLRYLLGEIVEVSAMLSNKIRNKVVEDTGVINLRFENGAIVSAMLSDAAPSPWHFEGASGENPNISHTGQGGLRIFGTKGSVEFPTLKQWGHENEKGHWGTPIFSSTQSISIAKGEGIALAAQLQNFAKVIAGEDKPLVSVFDGLQTVRVVEAIHESAKQGTMVTI